MSLGSICHIEKYAVPIELRGVKPFFECRVEGGEVLAWIGPMFGHELHVSFTLPGQPKKKISKTSRTKNILILIASAMGLCVTCVEVA